MHAISGNFFIQDVDTVLVANLTVYITHFEVDVAQQHLVAILRCLHDMMAVIMDAVRGFRILHSHVSFSLERIRPEILGFEPDEWS